MKADTFKISLIILAAFLLFTGASPWEGTAVIAPEGELPASGFFIATNSFPKNTLVDITNLETNQSTRVIVAKGTDSQGILAVVSREAAHLIGMKSGVINRIRIVQPVEPIAYWRFTEGLLSGNPVYDSGNAARDRLYSEDTFVPTDSEKTEPVTRGITGPRYILEPEWQNREIVNFPDIWQIPSDKEPDIIVTPVPEEEEETPIAEMPPSEKEEEVIPIVETPVPEEEEEAVLITETPPPEEEEEVVPIAETPVPEEEEEVIPIVETPPPPPQKLYIVPAPERPPEGSIYGIDPSLIIPGITSVAPVREPPPAPVIPETVFSVPKLTQPGYYVQLAAYRTAESTENAIRQTIRQIENYGPVVLVEGDNLYRILLGPLNQGESAAVLQRFKSIGYKDAFVRNIR